MNSKYKYLLKKIVCNKVRKIYIKINSKSKKQYLKYKGKMINIKKYKKIKNKKNNKKSKSYFKNKNKKKHKKKGGVYHEKFNVLMKKFNLFIEILESKDKTDIGGIQDVFLKTYTDIKNRFENEEKSIKEHFDFLTTILIYLDQNYSNLSDKKYRDILLKIGQLLQTIEESAITGIFRYSDQPTGNPYNITDSTNFQTIQQVITNFKDNYRKIIWNIFIDRKKVLNISNITISNTQISTLIRYMLSRNGLTDYIENYNSRYKPY